MRSSETVSVSNERTGFSPRLDLDAPLEADATELGAIAQGGSRFHVGVCRGRGARALAPGDGRTRGSACLATSRSLTPLLGRVVHLDRLASGMRGLARRCARGTVGPWPASVLVRSCGRSNVSDGWCAVGVYLA